MNEHFAEWYSIANPTADHQIVTRRWEAVEKVRAELDTSTVFDLARAYHGIPSVKGENGTALVAAVRAADAAFVPAGRELELAILAGVVLCEALSNDDEGIGDAAALSIIVPRLHGMRKQDHLPDLQNIAKQHMTDRSRELRATRPIRSSNSVVEQGLVEALVIAIRDSQLPSAAENLKKVISAQQNVFASHAERLSQLEMNELLFREESDIHWWLTGQYSRIVKQPFSTFDIGPASLLIGRELADLTLVLPGPFSAEALVARMLGASFDRDTVEKVIPLATAINGLSEDVRAHWASALGSHAAIDLCPVFVGVIDSTKAAKAADWPPLFKKSQGIDGKGKLAPLSLGLQIYLESLFLRTCD